MKSEHKLLIVLSVLIQSCAVGTYPESADYPLKAKLHKDFYLYEIHQPHSLSYVLWDINITGNYDGAHRKISKIEAGRIFTIESSKDNSNLYGYSGIRFRGTLTLDEVEYKFEGSCSKNEFDRMTRKP
jgi:hypothetical protein